MTLHSTDYIIFLGITLLLYYLLPKKSQPVIILLASIFFIAQFNRFTGISVMICVIIFYLTGILSVNVKIKYRKIVLNAGIILSVINLILLKYLLDYNLALINSVIINLGSSKINISSLAIPVGISYYTFTGIGYLIEIYKDRIKAEKNILLFTNYLVFFPKFSAGPIERADRFLNQVKQQKSFDYEMAVSGAKLILWGLFKKMVIADRLAVFVDAAYENPYDAGGLVLSAAAVLYSIQIYTDFSGYTDIARGTARIFGFKITDNFKRPYFSKSMSDFWTRWHISLSSWVRDYIFLPIAYKLAALKTKSIFSKNKFNYLISTAVTMTIIGIWHGIEVGFLIWSSMHIIFLFIGFIFKKKKQRKFKSFIKSHNLRKILSAVITFILITFSWIFFRAGSWENIKAIFRGFSSGYDYTLFNNFIKVNTIYPVELIYIIIFSLFLLTVEFIIEKRGKIDDIIKRQNIILRFSLYIIFVLIVIYFSADNEKFIYFQF